MIAADSLSLFRSSRFLGSPIAGQPSRRLLAGSTSISPRRRFSAACSATAVPPLTSASASPSLYDVLGVLPGATSREIKTAYRRLARECHPDVAAAGGSGSGGCETADADKFMRIHAAYATLSDPEKRADYDRMLFVLRRKYRPPPLSGFSRRTWETDQCW